MESKPASWYTQSGIIPYRRTYSLSHDTFLIEVLLITSRKRKRWIIPKGIVEPQLSPQQSAEKEAFEEAGIIGTLSDTIIGSYTYSKWQGVCNVDVFPLEVTHVLEQWPESSFRERRWMSVEDAAASVEEEQLKEMFRKLSTILMQQKTSRMI